MLHNEWREVVSLLTSDINCSKKKHLTGPKKYFVRKTTGLDGYVLLQRVGAEQEKIVPYCQNIFWILQEGCKRCLMEGGQTFCVAQRSLLAWVQARYADINYRHVSTLLFNKSFS